MRNFYSTALIEALYILLHYIEGTAILMHYFLFSCILENLKLDTVELKKWIWDKRHLKSSSTEGDVHLPYPRSEVKVMNIPSVSEQKTMYNNYEHHLL